MLLAFLFPFLLCNGHSETYVTSEQDRALAEKVLKELKAHQDEEPGELMVRAANALLGQPYVAGTLEELPDEKLCVYLTRTDYVMEGKCHFDDIIQTHYILYSNNKA